MNDWAVKNKNLSKKFGSLCSVNRVSLALNRVSFDSLFISLLNDAPFVRIMRLWDDKHI